MELEVLKYLESPPTRKELRATLDKLQMKPPELVRRGEAIFKTLELSDNSSNEEWLTAMIEHPIFLAQSKGASPILSQQGPLRRI